MRELFEVTKTNLSFLGVSLLIVIAFVAIAKVAEKVIKVQKDPGMRTRKIAFIGVFSAISGVLMCLELPVVVTAWLAPSFYRFDFSEIPILICAFAYGPVAGVVTEFLKVVIKVILKSTTTAFVGELANFIVGCAIILPASIIYYIKKNRKTALVGMTVGIITMVTVACVFNALYLLPTFANMFGMPLDAIIGMGSAINSHINSIAMFAVLIVGPFNLVKGVIDSALTFVLYKRVSGLIHVQHRSAKAGKDYSPVRWVE